MRRAVSSRFVALLGAVALLSGSCSDGGEGSTDTSVPGSTAAASTSPATTAPPTTAPPTTAPATEVTELEDVEYETGAVTTYESPPLMDVYAPADAERLPLIVLLHGGGADKDAFPVYDSLPEALAARGAVVAVPNWNTGSPLMPHAADAVALARCAISFAVGHATEWGADPGAVTLVGHSGGANVATAIAFDQATQPPGCPAPTWEVNGVLLWEGDWALADPSVWDEYGDQVSPVIPVLTPWMILDRWAGPATFMVTSDSIGSIRRCDDVDTWLPVRDPTGTIRAAFDAVGATDDGCIDPGDLSKALAQAMTDAGVANTYIELTGTWSTHTQLSSDDLELMADEAYALAAPGG